MKLSKSKTKLGLLNFRGNLSRLKNNFNHVYDVISAHLCSGSAS